MVEYLYQLTNTFMEPRKQQKTIYIPTPDAGFCKIVQKFDHIVLNLTKITYHRHRTVVGRSHMANSFTILGRDDAIVSNMKKVLASRIPSSD